MSKASELFAIPVMFPERLLKAYPTYTGLDLEAPENRQVIKIVFVIQSHPLIPKPPKNTGVINIALPSQLQILGRISRGKKDLKEHVRVGKSISLNLS